MYIYNTSPKFKFIQVLFIKIKDEHRGITSATRVHYLGRYALTAILNRLAHARLCKNSGVRITKRFPVGLVADPAVFPIRSNQA